MRPSPGHGGGRAGTGPPVREHSFAPLAAQVRPPGGAGLPPCGCLCPSVRDVAEDCAQCPLGGCRFLGRDVRVVSAEVARQLPVDGCRYFAVEGGKYHAGVEKADYFHAAAVGAILQKDAS